MDENDIFEPEQPRKRSKDFLKQQGFYIVLFVCLLIVGTAVALTALPRDDGKNVAPTPDQAVESRQSGDELLATRKTPVPTSVPLPTATPRITATPTPAPVNATRTSQKGQAPVEGEILWSFALDQLLYSRTLEQWTTHPGVDIAAVLESDVKAVLSGTILKIYKDDALGQVVTIQHNNDRVSLYANLDEDVPVKEGKKVNAGDVIGKIGTTALSECAEAPHLHLGFFVKGEPVDPMEYVTIPH